MGNTGLNECLWKLQDFILGIQVDIQSLVHAIRNSINLVSTPACAFRGEGSPSSQGKWKELEKLLLGLAFLADPRSLLQEFPGCDAERTQPLLPQWCLNTSFLKGDISGVIMHSKNIKDFQDLSVSCIYLYPSSPVLERSDLTYNNRASNEPFFSPQAFSTWAI